MVTVNLYAAARAHAGKSQLTVAAGSLGDILENISRGNSQLETTLKSCTFLVDGTACHGLATGISDGALLDILPAFAGG